MPSPSPPSCEKASASTEDDNKSRTELNKECQRCLSYLTNALKQPGKTQSLLKALGAVRPPSSSVSRNAADTTVNGNATTSSSQMYQLTSDRRGVVLHLDSRHAIHSPVMDATDRIQPRISLQKRLTNAASRMVYGATGADSNASGESGAVLTTSPKQGEIMHKQEMPKETTITIECMECGSETRAEAGARAYVRGPIPLSIILCSNRLSTPSEITEVLTHELIHVYDVFIRNMDLRQCHSLAYSEVRAAREAECDSSLTNFTKGICVKDKAGVATGNMFPEVGRGCVCDVFDVAMADLAPLGLEKKNTRSSSGVNHGRSGGGSDLGGGSGMTFMPKEARPSER